MAAAERRFTQLVVVGASAGGIEALSALAGALPEGFPAPIVVAQHLSPTRHSSLAEILSRRGKLPVRTVNAHEALEPGVIYVVPPNRDVSITDHEVRVTHEDGAGPRPSVDLLFRSAAEAFREELVAVILSGTGSDGAAGAREVKQAGGTVVIQNPETASFPGMPLSLSPSIVDIVANPENMGTLLHDLLTGAFVVPRPTEDNQFRSFLDQLREESGIDFSTYKQPTIMRRLQRRMAATSQSTLADYIRYIRRRPEERQRLIASFLIKVTEFFRDPELFTYLREQVLPELVAESRGRGGELRLWSAGCATGEEAYSLAMLVADLLGDEMDEFNVRIFATDLDNEAIAFARHGVYPARALAGMTPAMVERYFTEHQGEYEVKKAVRSCLIFGEHDLGQRAPFPRIDLILCRNVLIYFTAALQRRALQLFAFSLRPGGYLTLGKSETVSPLAEYFAVDKPRLKVYRRIGDRALIPPTRRTEPIPLATTPRPARRAGPPVPPRLPRASRSAPRLRGGGRIEEVLLGLPVAVAVVDREYDVKSINALARRLFGIHTVAIERDFLHQVRNYPAAPLRRVIDQAFAGEPTTLQLVRSDDDLTEDQRTLEVSAYPLSAVDDEGDTLVALVAIDVSTRERLQRSLEAAEGTVRRLTLANEEVLAANLELTGTIAKLRAENEELLVAGEEVQAATEEVETLNEELQASNEELETLNEELQATVEELNTTNDDLQARTVELQEMAIGSEAARSHLRAILDSIDDAVVVVDGKGSTVLTNPAYERMFGGPNAEIRPEDDIGRPLPAEESPLRRATRGETFSVAFTATAPDGSRRWHEAEGRPVPGDGRTQYGVVTIRDITERSLRHLQDQWLAIASHELRTPLAALTVYLQLARRSLPPETPGRTGDQLDRAQAQTRRIAALIDQMVDATRFEFGRIALVREPIDLEPVVRRAVETAQALGGEVAVRLTVDGDLAVHGDAARLEQAVLNLLTNALLHAADADRIDVRLRRAGEEAEIAVQNYGPGIPEDELGGVFERFRQGSGTTTGLGLGLYIAREIVTGHGGTIDVQSVEGEGAIFVIRLPILSDATPALEAAPSSS